MTQTPRAAEKDQDAAWVALDEADYRSYAYNRQRAPDITPERWMTIFGEHVTQMEERFQNERS